MQAVIAIIVAALIILGGIILKNQTAVLPLVPSTPSSTDSYVCNCKKTCNEMSSCAEAQYQLNVCGCSRRDADKDGIACDADCQ